MAAAAPPRRLLLRALSEALEMDADRLDQTVGVEPVLDLIDDQSVTQWDGGLLESARVAAYRWLASAPENQLRGLGVRERVVRHRATKAATGIEGVLERCRASGHPLKEPDPS